MSPSAWFVWFVNHNYQSASYLLQTVPVVLQNVREAENADQPEVGKAAAVWRDREKEMNPSEVFSLDACARKFKLREHVRQRVNPK